MCLCVGPSGLQWLKRSIPRPHSRGYHLLPLHGFRATLSRNGEFRFRFQCRIAVYTRICKTSESVMQYEVELKYRIDDEHRLTKLIEELDAELGGTCNEIDRYFNHPSRDFSDTDEALRIRSVGAQNVLTWKGPNVDDVAKMRHEIELAFASGPEAEDRMAEILLRLGFREVLAVHKARTVWLLNWEGLPLEFCVDDVEGLGTYVEIEAVSGDADRDAVRNSLLRLADRLKLCNPLRHSYLQALLRSATDDHPSPPGRPGR